MTTNVFRQWIIGALISVFIMSGCSVVGQESGESGMSERRYSVLRSGESVNDSVSIQVPPGWEEAEPVRYSTALYTVRRPGYVKGDPEGLSVRFINTAAYVGRNPPVSAEDVTLDIKESRDIEIEDSQSRPSPGVSDLRSIGERMIGGEEAAGMSYTYEKYGVRYYAEDWKVWRWDGMWRFTLISAPGEKAISRDLSDALDTVVWTPHEYWKESGH